MKALQNLNSTFRGREIERMEPSANGGDWTIEHTEIFCGIGLDIRRSTYNGRYFLTLKLRNGETLAYEQNNDIALNPANDHSTLAAAAWLFEHRYLPFIRLCSLGWADLAPATVEEFKFFCTLASNNFLPGECRVSDLITGMHEMIDFLQGSGMVIEVSEEASMLRQAVSNFQEQFEQMEAAGRLTEEEQAMLDRLRMKGHAVTVIQHADMGCARRDVVESMMDFYGNQYLTNRSTRAA